MLPLHSSARGSRSQMAIQPCRRVIIPNTHTVICGMTRSGKTHLAKRLVREWKGPAFCWDAQMEDFPGIGVAGHSTVEDILAALHAGEHLNYYPPAQTERANLVLEVIVSRVIGRTRWRPPLLLVIDEAQDYAPNGKPNCLEFVARRGLRFGVHGLFISQRPADMHKTLLTQSYTFVLFQTQWEGAYFSSKHFPLEQIDATLSAAGPYSYVVRHGGRLQGPFKETPT